jgi:hypothetical protein
MRDVIALYASCLVGPAFESWFRDRFWNFHDFTLSFKTLFGLRFRVSHDNILPHFATHFSLSFAIRNKSYERRNFKIRWSHWTLRLSYVLCSIDRTMGSLVWSLQQELMYTHDFFCVHRHLRMGRCSDQGVVTNIKKINYITINSELEQISGLNLWKVKKCKVYFGVKKDQIT